MSDAGYEAPYAALLDLGQVADGFNRLVHGGMDAAEYVSDGMDDAVGAGIDYLYAGADRLVGDTEGATNWTGAAAFRTSTMYADLHQAGQALVGEGRETPRNHEPAEIDLAPAAEEGDGAAD